MAHQREPLLDIHPADAARLDLADGGLARIESPHGATVLPVRLSPEQRRGEVFAPMHWTDRFTSAGPIDVLVGAATDPVSGQPELKATPVRVTAVPSQWHGLLLRRRRTAAARPYYWARVPLRTRTRLHAHRLGAIAARSRDRVLDFGAARCAGGGGTCDLCRSRPRHFPLCQRCWTAASTPACLSPGTQPHCRRATLLPTLFGRRSSPTMRAAVLAGNPRPAAANAGGRTICACFGVGLADACSARSSAVG